MYYNSFSVILILIVPQIVEKISNEFNIDNVKATELLYKSELYSLLEDEETKLWHYSPLTLFNMFCNEQKYGKIEFPEAV